MSKSPAALLIDANGNAVGVVLDGAVYRLRGEFKVARASDGAYINPATQETLASIDGKDFATQTTLAVADGRLSTIDSVLDSIKDTDGIKKITDPLPAGTNNIGDVDVVSSVLPTGAATEATLATRAAAITQTDGNQKTQVVDGTGDGLEIDASGRAAIQDQPNMDVALSTRATEATLLLADGRLTTIDAVLDSIKDTDGIKKITDQLPAGTNEIGKVAQGTKAAAADAWPQYVVDSSGNVVGVVLDGAVYRLRTETKVVRASDGAQINPATQETLVAIKDTDGIKKITDQLPAGTNEIGKVAQGTRAAASGGWPSYVVDSSGNAVGVVLDGSLYRFQTDSKVAQDTTDEDLVHLEAIKTTGGRGRLKASIFTPDGDPVAFGAISASIKNAFVLNGTSPDLVVNGGTTPVVFTYEADTTYDISIQEIKFTLVSNSITFGSNYFGAIGGPLTNGVLVEAVIAAGTVTLYNLRQNESFVNFASPGGFEWVVSSKDMVTSNYLIGGGLKLRANTSDLIKVTVRDNLASPQSVGAYFRCYVKGNLLTEI